MFDVMDGLTGRSSEFCWESSSIEVSRLVEIADSRAGVGGLDLETIIGLVTIVPRLE